MGKLLMLLVIILLALTSLGGYLLLTEKITTGRQQMADGQQQLEKGQKMLAEGKAKLANGKLKLSHAKTLYSGIDGIPLMGIVDKLPVSGAFFNDAKGQISEGDAMVAKGEGNVKMGEARLAAGKLALSRGERHLTLVNNMRLACVLGAAFFTLLAIMLGYYWRRSLTKI